MATAGFRVIGGALAAVSPAATFAGGAEVEEPHPLLVDLVAYWDLSEASGDRADDSGNGHTLTDKNTVTSDDGVGAGQTAALFAAANTEYFANTDAAFTPDGGDLSGAGWVRFDATSSGTFINYFSTDAFYIRGNGVEGQVRASVTDAVSGVSTTDLVTGISNGTYLFLYWQYDSATKKVGVSYNANALQEGSALSNGIVTTSSTEIRIGTRNGGSSSLTGAIQAMGFWTRTLTSDEITWLYNSGTAARLYADVAAYTG